MYFEINQKDFLKGLSLIQGILGRKTTLPILTHVLLESKENSVQLTGTDLEIGLREEITATIHEVGKASVSAKKLYEIIRELPDETIHVRKKENQWVGLQCGKSVFNLAGLDAEEFPSLPPYQEEAFSTLPSSLLAQMIEKTVFAASNEESRHHLNGIFFLQMKETGREKLRMVATDGHRLSLIDRESQGIRGLDKGIIIPKKGVIEIRKILADKSNETEVGVYFDQTHGFLKMGKSLVVIRLIDGEFPGYEEVIPKKNDKKLSVGKEKIYGCLRRVSTMASERGEGIKFSLRPNVVELSTFNQDFGDAREELEVAYEGDALEIGFNSRYLLDALNVIDTSEVILEMRDEGSAGLVKPLSSPDAPEQFCLIMPMRI